MIKTTYKYSGKVFRISPFNTLQEKDLLLLGTIGDSNLDDALEICNIEEETIKSLTEDEKVAMLYKLREISVGDDLNLKFTCKHCNSGNENTLNIGEIVQSSNLSSKHIIDQFKDLTDDNFQDFVDVIIDDLDIDEYESLLKEAKEGVTKFNFKKPIVCQKCGKENFVRINDPKFVIDNMSEDSVMSIYQIYNDLTFFGKYTKQDIDSLYPFERTILISLSNKTREDLNKS